MGVDRKTLVEGYKKLNYDMRNERVSHHFPEPSPHSFSVS